jgi:hypothetical protein
MPTCKTCFFSREFGSETAVACHRYPPTITKVEDDRVTSHFPLLGNDTWCGEYRVYGTALNKKFRTISDAQPKGVTNARISRD